MRLAKIGMKLYKIALFPFSSGIGNLKRWSDLPDILKKDNKKILPPETKGVNLIQSIIAALWEDYDISITYDAMVSFLATEICSKPEYTRYMNCPLSQEDINTKFLAFNKKDEYSRLVADMYIPAISNALDIHFRVIQNIAGYYGVINTFPLPNDGNPFQKKTITLIVIDDCYHLVVNVPGGVSAAYQTIDTVSTAAVPIVLLGEVSEEVLSEEPQSQSQEEKENQEKQSRKRKNRRLKKAKKSHLEPEEVIIISDESEDEGPGALGTPIKTPPRPYRVGSPESPKNNSQESVNYEQYIQQVKLMESQVKKEEEEDEDIPAGMVREDNTGKRINFEMRQFYGMIPEVVAKVPYNINGLKFYIIDVPEEDAFHTKYRDGRHFELHSSSRKGFKGVRRLGKCRGSFICNNKSCPLFIEAGKKNEHQFTTIGRNKFCYSCNCIVYRKPCSALKLVEFTSQGRLLEVYHQGKHTCQLKPNTEENDEVIEENIRRFGANVGPKDLAQMRMTEELKKQMDNQEFDMDKIIEIGASMSDKKRISNIKGKIQQELKSERHSLSAVAELKLCTDTADKYLIYKIHDQNMSGSGISFIFKSSKRMANLMLNMDQNRIHDNPLKHEPCYFDGMHKRCQNWKTLTLWVYHASSRKLMRLATCEVKGETSDSCALFWETLNQMLREVSKDDNIKFNPYLFIVDEAGANFNGIQKVFGEEGVRKAKSCTFHFKQSLQRMLLKFPADLLILRNEFEELMTTLLTVPTLREYRDLKFKIEQIAAVLPSLTPQINWWFARRYNLFPIFRGYCISSVNLAEIGHSTLKRAKPIALVDAAWEDTCTMILQEQEHTKFLAGRSLSSGKGPSSGTIAEKEKRQQLKRSREYQTAFVEQNFELGDDDGMFIPSKRAKHRHPEVPSAGIQGRDQIPLDEGESSGNARPPLQPKKFETNSENPPLLCFLQGFKISTCYGCKSKFTADQRKTPEDMILKALVVRDRLLNNKWIPGWKKTWGYFHLNINCLKLVRSYIEVEDIYIPNDVRGSLTPAHIQKLERMGWWSKMKMRY